MPTNQVISATGWKNHARLDRYKAVIKETFWINGYPSAQKKLAESCTLAHLDDGGSLPLRCRIPDSIMSIPPPWIFSYLSWTLLALNSRMALVEWALAEEVRHLFHCQPPGPRLSSPLLTCQRPNVVHAHSIVRHITRLHWVIHSTRNSVTASPVCAYTNTPETQVFEVLFILRGWCTWRSPYRDPTQLAPVKCSKV